jgi:hypothetical protein
VSNLITNICRPLRVTPAQKAVLMALADRSDDDGAAWPSVAWISEWTCLGRSTVIRSMSLLEDLGMVAMQRAEGRPSRCTILVGNVIAACAPVPQRDTPRPAAGLVDGDSDEADPSRCGTGAEDEPVPDRDPYPSQSGTGPDAAPVPQRDTHPSRSGTPPVPQRDTPRPAAGPDTPIDINKTSEQTKTKRATQFDPTTIELPDWMPAETWAMWVRYRAEIKKPLTADAARLQLGRLAKFLEQGHSPKLIVEAAVENRWQGLYLPKDGSTFRGRAPVAPVSGDGGVWWQLAGFEHPAEAANVKCHIGNYREFRDGKRIDTRAPA